MIRHPRRGLAVLVMSACGLGGPSTPESPPSSPTPAEEASSEGAAPAADAPSPPPAVPPQPSAPFGRIVKLEGDPADGLSAALAGPVTQAEADGLVPFLLITTPGCVHCRAFLGALDHPEMIEARRGTLLVRFSILPGSAWLMVPPLDDPTRQRVPGLHRISPEGTLGALVTGDAWGEDDPTVMAAVVADFVRRHGVDLPPPDAVPDPPILTSDPDPLPVLPDGSNVQFMRLPAGAPLPTGAEPVRADNGAVIFKVPASAPEDGSTRP